MKIDEKAFSLVLGNDNNHEKKSHSNEKKYCIIKFRNFHNCHQSGETSTRSDTSNKIRTLSVSGVPLISLCFVKSDPKLD